MTPHPSTSRSLGLIGLGLMGQALAARLLEAGFDVLGWDVRDEARAELQAQGGQVAANAAEVFATQERLLLSLPDSDVVAAVLAQARAHLRPGQVVVDTSTGCPQAAAALAADLARLGAVYVDAPLSGSSAQVRAGTAVAMVGADEAAFAACADLWAAVAERAFHTGPPGTGARMKLATNLVLGLNRAALAEGLAFAQHLGLDPAATLEVMRGGMAYSRIMDTKGERMLRGEFSPPQARLSQHLKDVRLMLAQPGGPLPLTEAHRALLERAEALGCGGLDNSAVIRAYQELS